MFFTKTEFSQNMFYKGGCTDTIVVFFVKILTFSLESIKKVPLNMNHLLKSSMILKILMDHS